MMDVREIHNAATDRAQIRHRGKLGIDVMQGDMSFHQRGNLITGHFKGFAVGKGGIDVGPEVGCIHGEISSRDWTDARNSNLSERILTPGFRQTMTPRVIMQNELAENQIAKVWNDRIDKDLRHFSQGCLDEALHEVLAFHGMTSANK